MKTQSPQQNDHISVSQVNEYLGCQQQYWFHRISEETPTDVSSSLIVGSAYHCALEMYYRGLKEGKPADLLEMTSVFEQVLFEEEAQQFINWGRSSRDEEVRHSGAVFQAFLDGQTGNEIVAVEEMFRLDLEGLPVPIIGRVDLLERVTETGAIKVVDFKTSRTKPAKSTDLLVGDDLDANLQMTVYWMWARRQYPDQEIGLRMDYLVKTKEPQYIRMATSRTPTQEQQAAQLIRRAWNQIEMMRGGVIEPLPMRSFRCTGCGWRCMCGVEVGRSGGVKDGMSTPSVSAAW